MKVLYLGPTWRGSNAQSWRRAFEALGHEVAVVDPDQVLAHRGHVLAMRIVRKLTGRMPLVHRRALQDAVTAAAHEARPDLVFACRAVWLEADTIGRLRRSERCTVVHWHPDDYRNPDNTSSQFRKCIPLYDVCVTPKSFNVAELESDGARRVEYVPYAYDPEVHRPVAPRSTPPFSEACFVGTWEPERAASLEYLARRGIRLEVWGPYWQRLPSRSPLRAACRFRDAVADDMSRVFNSSMLSLGFLRKVNRDRHTARTFEIPACGGVMLAERTEEQSGFFEEDVEALYFGTDDELLEKTRDYAGRLDAVTRIRSAALARCATSRYRYADRLADLLARLELGR